MKLYTYALPVRTSAMEPQTWLLGNESWLLPVTPVRLSGNCQAATNRLEAECWSMLKRDSSVPRPNLMPEGAMLVEIFSRTLAKTGLRVGVENVQRFFPESITEIDLRLGHLQIVCKLDPEFWRSQPEIFDERLSAWLESKHLHVKPKETPTRLAMVPIGTGTNVFRLRLLSPNERKIEQSETRSKERRT